MPCFDETCDVSRSHGTCDSNCTDGLCVLCIADNGINDPVVIQGTTGNDVICVQSGNTGSGTVNVTAKGGIDLIATRANDSLYGHDFIDTGAGNDTVYAGAGNDFVDNYSGTDVINGGPGDDTLIGSSSAETLNGEDGNDYLDGLGGDDTLNGGTGRNVILGGSGDDTITTVPSVTHDAFGSVICGQAGNDTINVSGYGAICIDAGTDTDSCRYTKPAGADLHEVASSAGCETVPGDPLEAPLSCLCP